MNYLIPFLPFIYLFGSIFLIVYCIMCWVIASFLGLGADRITRHDKLIIGFAPITLPIWVFYWMLLGYSWK